MIFAISQNKSSEINNESRTYMIKHRKRTISNSKLKTSLPRFSHFYPIKPIFYGSPMSLFKGGFVLRCFQHLSPSAQLPSVPCQVTGRPEAPNDRSSRTKPSFPSDIQTLPVDIKQTASQRSEPSSRILLMGEHPHPQLLLHNQDRMSRHRCSKPRRRFELSGATTLLSPE